MLVLLVLRVKRLEHVFKKKRSVAISNNKLELLYAT